MHSGTALGSPEALTTDANCHHGQHVRFSARHLICQGCSRHHKAQRRPGPPFVGWPSGHTLRCQAEGVCSNGSVMAAQVAAGFHQHQRAFIQHHHGGVRVRTGLGSAAIAACTAAIFSLSEFTHCRPEAAATACRASTGSVKGCTRGMPAGAASGAAATGFATGAATTGRLRHRLCRHGRLNRCCPPPVLPPVRAPARLRQQRPVPGLLRRRCKVAAAWGFVLPPRLLAQRLRCLAVPRLRWCRRPARSTFAALASVAAVTVA